MRKYTLIFISLLTTTFLVSCSSEDLDNFRSAELNAHNNNFIYDSELVGHWDLSAIVSSSAVDLNADGEINTNLLSETDCFSPMSITFNGDKTFTAVNVKLDLKNSGDEDIFSCKDNRVSYGIWSLKDDILSLILTVGGKQVVTKKQIYPENDIFQFEVNRIESNDYIHDQGGTSASGLSIIHVEYTRTRKN